MKGILLSLALAFTLWAAPALADVERFAVVIGNNVGLERDLPLKYAETDATKIYEVLVALGNFPPANLTLLHNATATTVRSTLIAINDRIRAGQRSPSDQALLFVYYSGHADAQSLHLAGTQLRLQELAQLVRGSSATFRLLVADACRSGALTRVKGGTVIAPFQLRREHQLPGQGLAFLTASAANEDAQESDEVQGSFFTHALVSGLMGAADSDGDGSVVLEEAYRHARDATVRATSRTYAGTQHPTFQYEVRGQDSLVLTQPGTLGHRGRLQFPQGVDFLVLASNAGGPVVGEVGGADSGRELNLRPGNYLVRGRTVDYLLEGTVFLGAGQTRVVTLDELDPIQYAQLVRKGTGRRRRAQSVLLGGLIRSPMLNATGPCYGGQLGYDLHFREVSWSGRVAGCTASLRPTAAGANLAGRTNEVSILLGARRAWDLSPITADVGAMLGAAVAGQTFETRGVAPPRWTLVPQFAMEVRLSVALWQSSFLALQAQGLGALLSFQEDALAPRELRYASALSGGLLYGLNYY